MSIIAHNGINPFIEFQNIQLFSCAVYFHFILSMSSLRKEGYMKKLGAKFKTWKRRYFILKGSSLSYYQQEGGKMIGTIYLTPQCTITMSLEKSNCIELKTSDRTWFFVPPDEMELNAWQGAIQEGIWLDH